MNKFLYNLKESRIFQFIVISIIILNAITIGVNTYELSKFTKQAINYLDYSITIFFLLFYIGCNFVNKFACFFCKNCRF